MKALQPVLFAMMLGSLASCVHVTDGGGGVTRTTCTFKVDTLSSIASDSGINPFVSDVKLDSSRSYTYNIQPANGLDSLLLALCRAGFDVQQALYIPSPDYQCMDPRGPRPVVELNKADSRILTFQQGFMQGAYGRLECGSMEFRYTPK